MQALRFAHVLHSHMLMAFVACEEGVVEKGMLMPNYLNQISVMFVKLILSVTRQSFLGAIHRTRCPCSQVFAAGATAWQQKEQQHFPAAATPPPFPISQTIPEPPSSFIGPAHKSLRLQLPIAAGNTRLAAEILQHLGYQQA